MYVHFSPQECLLPLLSDTTWRLLRQLSIHPGRREHRTEQTVDERDLEQPSQLETVMKLVSR